MKIAFMGTPDFAVAMLKALIDAGHQICCVVTQPDRAKNRGKKILFTPVKETALENGIPVLQPEKIRQDGEVLSFLQQQKPELIVVAAYGQIIPPEILYLPRFGCINVHASLLPELRGASPIQHAILQGKAKTGVTIMQMAEGLDTGDMLAKTETDIGCKNGQALHDELAELGAALLIRTIPLIEQGRVNPEKQDDRQATYAGLITRNDGRIDFSQEPQAVERKIRAFDPWPGAFCDFDGQQMKIWKAQCIEGKKQGLPGEICGVSDEGIDIICGNGILRAEEIQLPGKKRMEVKAFLRGNFIEKGRILG